MAHEVLSLFGKNTIPEQFHVEGQPSFDFLHQVHWFVPTTLYRCEITLERPYQSKLNCFESAVLKLLELSHRDPATLAEMLCFHGDAFVRLLLSDLKDRGLIDVEARLTPTGRKELENQREKPPETKSVEATFFQNNLTGTLFPYVHIPQEDTKPLSSLLKPCNLLQEKPLPTPVGSPSNKKQENPKNQETTENTEENAAPTTAKEPPAPSQGRKRLSFSDGSTGEKVVIRGNILSNALSKDTRPAPVTPKEALTVLKEYRQYTQKKGSGENWEISLDYLGKSLLLHPQGNLHYYHLQGGKVNGDGDALIISDGFFPSLVDMVRYMEKHQPDAVTELHNHAIIARRLEQEGSFFENETYPALKGSWTLSLSSYSGSKDMEKALESAILRCIVEMYGELEWALFYYFQKNPVEPSLLAPFEKRSRKENRETLEAILDQTCLTRGRVDLTSQFDGRTPHPKSTPTMTALVPLLLLGWKKGSSGILSLLQQKLPKFYEDLCYLHPIRNKAIHEGVRHLTYQDFIYYQTFAKEFLDILLPDWNLRRYHRKQINENNSDTNRRLIAKENLYQEFGFHYANQYLTKEMTETLLELAPENRHPCSPSQYVNRLCLLLELAIAQGISLLPPPDAPSDVLSSVVLQEEEFPLGENAQRESRPSQPQFLIRRFLEESLEERLDEPLALDQPSQPDQPHQAEQVPLTTQSLVDSLQQRYHITLPISLTTVKDTALTKALGGEPSTLGAEVLAFLHLDPSVALNVLLKNNALTVIDLLISLRGHGNEQSPSSLLLTQTELEDLRRIVVSIMKGMIEYGKEKEENIPLPPSPRNRVISTSKTGL